MRAAKEELKASLRYSSIRDLLDGAGANSSSDAIRLRTESGTAAIAAADRAGARAIEEQLCFASLWAGASRDETRDRISFEADGAAGRSGPALPRELGFASRWSAANSLNIATRRRSC